MDQCKYVGVQDKLSFLFIPSCRCQESEADPAPMHRAWVKTGISAKYVFSGTGTVHKAAHRKSKGVTRKGNAKGCLGDWWERVVLTALDGVGGHLQRQCPAVGLRDVDAEDQPHSGVLPPNVRLPFAKLNVRVSELQDPSTVNAAENKHNAFPWSPRPNPCHPDKCSLKALWHQPKAGSARHPPIK